MKSRWSDLKLKSSNLRKVGLSLRRIHLITGVPKSTLSGWFKNIELNKTQKSLLEKNRIVSLSKARAKAVLVHNKKKAENIKSAHAKADSVLQGINLSDETSFELALSMLYLAEGAKKQITSLGNSDPDILRFFIAGMIKIYNLKKTEIKCDLHIRFDQDPESLKKFWSKELSIPIENFRKVSVDNRTVGKATRSGYQGVCVVSCGNIAIQRKLIYLSKKYCRLVSERAVSSVGRARR